MAKIFFGIIFFIFTLSGCAKADFTIQNKAAKVLITNPQWGKFSISANLYPGENTGTTTFYKGSDYLGEFTIKFHMSAKNNGVYLETADKYSLYLEESKIFIIDDNTKVINPVLVRSKNNFITINEIVKDLSE